MNKQKASVNKAQLNDKENTTAQEQKPFLKLR